MVALKIRWLDYVLIAFVCFLCSVQIVQPFMCDHEIYARGGKVLLDGGLLYTDFIDVKPPLIYVLFALWMTVVGSSSVALRLMEVCLHIITAILMFRTVYEHTRSRVSAHAATLASGAYIASLWMTSTLQPETLAMLPLLLLIRVGARSSATTGPNVSVSTGARSSATVSWKSAVALGCIAGVLFTLKYPLVLAAAPVIWMVARRSTAWVKMLSIVTVSFLAVVVLVFAGVWYDGIVEAMQRVATFLSGYGSAQGGTTQTLRHGLDNVTDFIANDMSMLFTTFALVAVVAGMMRGGKRDLLFVTTVSVIVALAISILIERKFNVAHMPRLIPPLAILVGYGLPIVWHACTRAWKNRTFIRPVLIAMALIALILSPLPRVIRSTSAFVMVISNRNILSGTTDASTGMANHAGAPSTFSQDGLISHRTMDSTLSIVRAANPRSVVVLGEAGTLLYWYLPGVIKSKFAQAHFFTSTYAPVIWNTEALREAEAADIVVLLDDDANKSIAGHSLTTRDVLFQRPEWVAMFEGRTLLHEFDHWSVWGR